MSRALDIGAALVVVLTLVGVFFVCLHPIPPVDFWWQAKTGELILTSGAIPRQDPFSWTAAGQPWLVHEWLTEVLFYLLLTKAPPSMLLAYKCGLAVVSCGLVLAHSWKRSGHLGFSVGATLLAAWILRSFADLRPQMLSFVLLAGLMWALHRYRREPDRRLLWAMPAVFLLWANLHGGVVVGLVLVGSWVLGEFLGDLLFDTPSPGLGRLFLSWAACLIAVAINPNGFSIYTYPFQVLGHPEVRAYITEWLAPDFQSSEMRPALMLLLLLFGVMSLRRTRGALGETLVLCATAYAALVSQRNTVPFGLVAAPILAAGLTEIRQAIKLPALVVEALALPAVRLSARVLLVCATGAHVMWSLPRSATGSRDVMHPGEWLSYATNRRYFPVDAVGELAAGKWPGPIYNDYVWGGYLIWNLYPDRKVFIDGRAEVYYPSGTFEDEMKIHQARPGFVSILDRRGVATVLTARGGRLAATLQQRPDWQLVFKGANDLVFARRRPSTRSELAPPHDRLERRAGR